MSADYKKDLDYVVLTSDPGGDEHGANDLKRVRTSAIKTLKATADFINKNSSISTWINTGDFDDLYEAGLACTKDKQFNVAQLIEGNLEFYCAVNAVYEQCRLAPEKKLVVLGNHDIPVNFLQAVQNCTLVGADILTIAQHYTQKTEGKIQIATQITPVAQINEIPIIGAMNTLELPSSIPKQLLEELLPHLTLVQTGFYSQYEKAYAKILAGKYYMMSHKGLINKKDVFRKEEDTIHKIAANSLASFEAHFHELTAKKEGKTVRLVSGTDYILVVGLSKKTGEPQEVKKGPIL